MIRVRLAKPPSVIVKTYCGWTSRVPSPASLASASASASAATWSARITDIDSTSSPLRNFMPVTPDVARPIGRS